MPKRIDRVGEKHMTNEGYEIEIIEYNGVHNCTVKFLDTYSAIVKNRSYTHVLKGKVSNPYHPSVHGVGYLGVEKRKVIINDDVYKIWVAAFQRCYSEKHQEKYPTYKGCTVDEHWYNFQVFIKWHKKNFKDYMQGWHLDKDILVKGNKIYSPETCCFVPHEINGMFVKKDANRGEYPIGVHLEKRRQKFVSQVRFNNKSKFLGYYNTPEEAFQAYKIAKEAYIKELADKYKNQITEACYQAIYEYKVEITD